MTTPAEPGPAGGKLPTRIAILALAAIAVHFALRFAVQSAASFAGLSVPDWPLVFALVVGGFPLVLDLAIKAVRRQFGSDLLAGISIVTAVVLGELLAGTLVVLMLSAGRPWRRTPSAGRRTSLPPWPDGCRRSPTGRLGPAWRTYPSTGWRSGTWWPCSPTKSARWTGRWSRGGGRWTSRI